MSTIRIDTGVKVFDIENEKGELLGQLRINPTDMNIFTRATDFKNLIIKWLDEVETIEKENAELTEDEFTEYLRDYDTRIKKEVNIFFDDDKASEIVFGNQSVFSTLNGVSFIERFMQAIFPIIQKCIEDEKKASESRIKKYTSQVN